MSGTLFKCLTNGENFYNHVTLNAGNFNLHVKLAFP